MADAVILDDETYISSQRASDISGYARDYIGYLARKALVNARRIGGLWYVSERSLKEYKQQTETFRPEPPIAASGFSDPDTFVSFDGKEYVSAGKGAGITGYHQDYIGQLARGGKILSRQVGGRWYVNRDALLAHKKEKDALLGAVQAEAVGLRKSVAVNHSKESMHDDGPLMTYTSDDTDLMPVIALQKSLNYESREADTPISAGFSVTHAIPIRKIDVPRKHFAERKPGGSLKIIGPSIVLATIVIVVVVGYMSIQSNALYSVLPKDANFAISGRFVGIISRVGDFVESVLAPELSYKRN